MNKKFLSIIVVIATITSVTVMFFQSYNQYPNKDDIMPILKANEIPRKEEITIGKDRGSGKKELETKASNQINNKAEKAYDTLIKPNYYRPLKWQISLKQLQQDQLIYYEFKYGKVTVEEKKDAKSKESANVALNQKKKVNGDEGDVEKRKEIENKGKDINPATIKSDMEEVPVFKNGSEKAKVIPSEDDKERLMVLGKKLSVTDYSIIRESLEKDDVKKAIYLLQSKLSNKEIEKIKDIVEKYTG